MTNPADIIRFENATVTRLVRNELAVQMGGGVSDVHITIDETNEGTKRSEAFGQARFVFSGRNVVCDFEISARAKRFGSGSKASVRVSNPVVGAASLTASLRARGMIR